jgi:c(7)-type cytochrome triheme protein
MRNSILLSAIALVFLTAFTVGAAEYKDVTFNFKNAGPVVFSHELHLKKYNNKCKICHNAIFNLNDRRHYSMADMEKTRSCGACHTGVNAFSVKNEKECIRCHKGNPQNVTYPVKSVGAVVFSHAVHLTKTGGACQSCHSGKVITKERGVTMAQMEKGKQCGACHNGKRTFTVAGNCDRCHKGLKTKDIAFTLKTVPSVTFSHSFHLQAYKCDACHTKIFPFSTVVGKVTMDGMSKGKSCGACHNGKDAFSSAGDCATCHKGYKPGIITFKTDGGLATFSHDFHLQSYKCADCHTKIFPYKAGTLKASMSAMESGTSCGACHNKGKDAFPVQDDCGKCHKM